MTSITLNIVAAILWVFVILLCMGSGVNAERSDVAKAAGRDATEFEKKTFASMAMAVIVALLAFILQVVA